MERFFILFVFAGLLNACTKYNTSFYVLQDKGVIATPSSMTIMYQAQTMQFSNIGCELTRDTLIMSGSNGSNSFLLALPVSQIQSATYNFNSQSGKFYIYDSQNYVVAQASGADINLSVAINPDGTLGGVIVGDLLDAPYSPPGNGNVQGNFTKVSVYVAPGSQ